MQKNKCAPALFVLLILIVCLAPQIRADVTLPKIIDSHMVLQRDMPLPIWGWAEAGEEVSVQLDGNAPVKTKADDKGNWKVTLSAVKADGKPHHLTITGKNKIELTDILIGEVWIGSGQSNMEWPLSATVKSNEAVAAANHPQIRLFHVPKVQSPTPNKDVNAKWQVCTPATVPNFSGVLYYFGLKLHKELGMPVGLINSSWGGSPIEPWIVGGGMYNGMIAPVKPFAMRGATWYQGESNVGGNNNLYYFHKKKDLIEGWRKVWGQNLSFHFVQLAPWKGQYPPGKLPLLWETQVASLKIPGTGMAVITDLVDNLQDIHPKNKLDVGNRLALWALAKDYGKKDLVYSGPLYKSMAVEGSKIRLSFAHTGGGLKSRDG
ncbi:MAG: 9-O-acetylesterase, partial [Pirellulales bacterium]|nr:9-O-acetylesterase [Pirellulales bacterium]